MCRSCEQWKKEYAAVQDIRQGALPPEFGEVEINYRPKKKDKKPRKRAAGCPENDGKAHVYVWEPYEYDDLFRRYFGFASREEKVCCGCLKPARKYRDSEKYTKKFGKHKRHKYDHPEYRDEGFREYRRKWLVQRGYTPEYYGWLF